MPSFTVNICALTLVLLSCQQVAQSRPHDRTKRGLVKDYFVPDSLVFSSDKFEKGEDGKFYLKKSAHRSDSKVTYSLAEEGNNVLQSKVKSGDAETGAEREDKIESESEKKETTKEKVLDKMVIDTPTASVVEIQTSSKAESIAEGTLKKAEIDKEKAPFTPTDPKFVVPSKPDSKDEIPLKTDLTPVDIEEKVEEKITIGQVPDLYSRLMPVPGTFRVPVIIPVRQISYGAVKVVPLPPSEVSDRLPLPPADVSDRLPLPPADVSHRLPPVYPPVEVSDRLPLPYEDDIIGEGAHESESEPVSQPIAEEKKDNYYHRNPLIMGLSLPVLPFRTLLKDLKETDAQNSEKQAKVVDVLGKKFLMQSNVMKYPTGDSGHLFLRFLSVKPLEEVKPITVPKEILAEESLKKTFEEAERKSIEEHEKKEEESMAKEEIIKKEDDSEAIEKEEEVSKEAEILKAEETQIKMLVEEKVPKVVIIENMGTSEAKNQGSSKGETKYVKDVIEDVKMYKNEPAILTSHNLKGEDKSLEKTESQLVETKVDIMLKESANRDKQLETKSEEDDRSIVEETREKAVNIADGLMQKGDSGKDIEMASKKDFFLIEKKKKFTEEIEEVNHKKKIEKKKKKKCKCEEKDSDSDDDDE